MGKKSRAERQQAHRAFETRHANIKKNDADVNILFSPGTVTAAAAFAFAACPETATRESNLALPVLEKIATGRFAATRAQTSGIIKAAKSLGWSAPESTV